MRILGISSAFLFAVVGFHIGYVVGGGKVLVLSSLEKAASRLDELNREFREALLAAKAGEKKLSVWAIERLKERTKSIINALQRPEGKYRGFKVPVYKPKSRQPQYPEPELPKLLGEDPKIKPRYPPDYKPRTNEDIGIWNPDSKAEELGVNPRRITQKREISDFDRKVELLREAYKKAISSLGSAGSGFQSSKDEDQKMVKMFKDAAQRFEQIQKFVKQASKYSDREKEVSEYFEKVYERELERTKRVHGANNPQNDATPGDVQPTENPDSTPNSNPGSEEKRNQKKRKKDEWETERVASKPARYREQEENPNEP